MFFIKLIRLIFGYVTFSGDGGFTERFINLSARNGINIWNLSAFDGNIKACTTIDDYKKIRKCAKKSGVRIRIKERHGLPFIINRNKNRYGLVVGLIFFSLSLYLLSFFIWNVRVEGNENITSSAIASSFEELGVKVGAKSKSLDTSLIQIEAYRQFPEYSWTAVNVEGSTATVQVRERTEIPYVVDKQLPCNIVAKCDGVVIRLERYVGSKEVEDGYPVTKGEMLINGITENEDKTSVLRHAQGKCIAFTEHKIEVNVPFKREACRFNNDRAKRYSLYVLNKEIPLWFFFEPKTDYQKMVSKKLLTLNSVVLPFGIIKEETIGYDIVEETLTKNEAILLAGEELLEKMAAELKGAEIISRKIKTEFSQDGVRLIGEFSCKEDIAVEEEIKTEK
ncbi:MAG: sporulation protein YqfD [Clostridiales bacterium]|nr:sporulation protein YqfD [Clostridiales bacterium]